MYNTNLNNYHLNPKNSTIYTPKEVSEFLFNLISPLLPNPGSLIIDPCCGGYSLLTPWKKANYHTLGIDNNLTSLADDYTDFLQLKQWIYQKPTLIICNPPFNGYQGKLGSEVWLQKIIELFGKETPLVLFTPMSLRLNSNSKGSRQAYPAINSIISLPRSIFAPVEFHSEILIFNIPNLQPHYFFTPIKSE